MYVHPASRCGVQAQVTLYSQTADCLISAQARRKCHISDDDLRLYFSRDTRIVVPRLPTDDLRPVVDKVLAAIPTREAGLKTAKHLLACWVCACQRLFVQIVARESLLHLLLKRPADVALRSLDGADAKR